MCPQRVGAHAGAMFTNNDFTSALVADRQRQARRDAQKHRLARVSRGTRRSVAPALPEQPGGRVLHLPARVGWADPREERAAS